MKTLKINGNTYRLPSILNPFQEKMYLRLIDWKWAQITREPGFARGECYDAILPDSYAAEMPVIYPAVKAALREHQDRFPFRLHTYFNHMASSQAANVNLFLPLLLHPRAADVFGALRPDFARLATAELDRGFRIEYWDEPFGNLRDKNMRSGTDADIAIAYDNPAGELCLWLIEHKLTESEFTTCGGYKSAGRKEQHDCGQRFAAILNNQHLCYYHDVRKFAYWEITARNQDFFPNPADFPACPFQGGLNQLWRNQLLALSVEQDTRLPYQHVSFSVVRHPGNTALDASLAAYQRLIGDNAKFSTFTSADVLAVAARIKDAALDEWIGWYRGLYGL